MTFNKNDTALVVIDPQNDVLSEKGVSWGLVGDSVKENNTVENIARLFTAAKEHDFGVFISPHYLYPADQAWQFGGAVEKMMLDDKEFYRPDPLSLDGFSGSGADWLERYKPFIEDGKTVVVSPHKVWGPQTQRPRPATPQAPHRQSHPGRDAGEPLRRKPPARIAGAGFRGRRREGRNGRSTAPRNWATVTRRRSSITASLANAVLTTDDAVKAHERNTRNPTSHSNSEVLTMNRTMRHFLTLSMLAVDGRALWL